VRGNGLSKGHRGKRVKEKRVCERARESPGERERERAVFSREKEHAMSPSLLLVFDTIRPLFLTLLLA
jgi:hypothetical protein